MTQANGGETARYLVLFEEDASEEGARTMTRVAGVRTVPSLDLGPGAFYAHLAGADGVLWPDLGVALITAAADQIDALTHELGIRGPIAMLEPERQVFAISAPESTAETGASSDNAYTWGLVAVNAPNSTATGAGVRVAVLDTGFDVRHPDFAGRTVVTSSFVDGEDVADGHGHGTHCIGSA